MQFKSYNFEIFFEQFMDVVLTRDKGKEKNRLIFVCFLSIIDRVFDKYGF